MALTIALHTPSSIPLEVDSVRMENVRAQNIDAVRTTLIQRGNQQVSLGEFFSISGSANDDETMVWQGELSKVKLIGTGLASGKILVEGNVGMHLGAEMRGGEITVRGNAADWLGAELHGGRIRVHGNAGHMVGAVYRGGHKGMTGGEILIDGSAGNEMGNTMRRGLIVVGGPCGDFAGVNMIAGSVLVFGEPGIRCGAGMKRGTVGLLGTSTPDILPTFKYACTYQPTFLRVYLKYLLQLGFPVPAEALHASYKRYCGDLLEVGKGELLTKA
ncbi:MAG: formylmethanofuran dehydrogenase subunit C [Planctomycetota bacterium]|nr:MAG: formylmethanofuran dehydrogenase subunit C [Planctomycetota bacterium]